MDELAKRARTELEPPWDDVREARVLSRVLESGEGVKARRAWRTAAVVAGVAAAAAALGLWLKAPAHSGAHSVAPPPMARASTGTPAEPGSVLALADGSKAYLKPGAELQALAQSPTAVRLSQTKGEVRYEVKPDPLRPFTVLVRNVEVRVIGTVFTVTAEPGGVRVSVERGRVAVKSGEREVELAPGESVRLSSTEAKPEAVQAPQVPPTSDSTAAAPSSSVATVESAVHLVDEADAARARGDLPAAERALRTLLSRYPSSPQATSAAFTLGRLQRARGDFAAAARTFDALRQHAPAGPLAEDALAEAANSWALAGQSSQASALAGQYLVRYPKGPHADRMRRLGPQ
jgi:transmembrane sensor